nr:multiheme c-type cytochrome [uncultured Capnocytophaga sp.]
MTKRTIIVTTLVIAFIGVIGLFYIGKEEPYSLLSVSEEGVSSEGYAGSISCQQCHAKEYKEWTASDHYKAMQVATDSTVLGDFNNTTYTADGITSRFFKRDGKYYINTQGEDGTYGDYEVRYTFGYYPLQQYITDFPNGKKQVFRQSWDSRQHKWFHQYAGEVIPPDDYLHWTRSGQNWNLMCASCHSTNLQKNLDPYTDSYQTTYSELTVGCESCHGGGKTHIESKGRKRTFRLATQTQELNACMPCHTRRGEVSQNHAMVGEVMDEYLPEVPVTDLYYADGQVLGENYKYASFLQSKMYQRGVRCTSCHSPHTGKLKAEGSKVCLQCHAPKYATEAHTYHKGNTAESDCRVCHMPTRTYMGNDVRHDHNFYVPRPDLTAQYNTPNACNACHTDKTAQWASKAVEGWYGKERRAHFAVSLIKGSKGDIPSLRRLLEDKNTPAIVRASAIHYLGGQSSEERFALIKKELGNADPQTRYRAVIAIGDYPLNLYERELLPLLTNKVKAVRMMVANVLLTQKGLEACRAYNGFEQAHQEYRTFVLSQADFPLGSATAGDYFVKIEDVDKAIGFYERALLKDKQLNYIRLNLATLYNSKSENNKAEHILQVALRYEPKNGQVYYYLGLLYNEQQRYKEAKEAFEKAMKLGMNSEALRRNYQEILKFI